MGAVRSKTLVERMGFNDPDLLSPMHDSIVLWIGDHVPEYIARIYDPWRKLDHCKKRAHQKIAQAINNTDESIKYNAKQIDRHLAQLQQPPETPDDPDDPGYSDYHDYHKTRDYHDYHKAEVNKGRQKHDELAEKRQRLSTWLDAPIALPAAPPFPKYETKFEVPVVSGRDFIIGFVDAVTTVTSQTLNLPDDYEENWITKPPVLLFADDSPWNIYFEAKTTIPSLGELMRQIRTYQQYIQGRFVVVSPDTRFQRHIESQGIEFWECVL